MTSGEHAYKWSLSDFDDMQDHEIIEWYKSLVTSLEDKNAALERALKDKHRG